MTPDTKPFSQACMNNRQPILATLKRVLSNPATVLEIGSGTGQHAVYFAEKLPHLHWQASDVAENLPGIQQWLADQPRPNLPEPVELDVLGDWPELDFDAAFTANTLHIMPWPTVQSMIAEVGARLPSGGLFLAYGPFNYNGDYTSESNARFDIWLKASDPRRGIRDIEKVSGAAQQAGLEPVEDNAMPANNRLIVWRKST